VTAGLRSAWWPAWRTARAMPAAQVALRAVLVLTGVVAFALLPDRGGSLAGAAAWLVPVALPFAAVRPGSDAPAVVVGAAAVSWLVGYGGQLPPAAATMLLGTALYLHHLAAAFAAAAPPTAALDRRLLRRWSVPLLAGLAAAFAAAVAAYGSHQLPLSPVLEIAGVAAVLAASGLLVLLTRR
jgi:hypothetical protein